MFYFVFFLHKDKGYVQIKSEVASQVVPLRWCLLSTACILHIFWFSVLHLRNNMYVVTFNSWVTNVVNGDLQQGEFMYSVRDIL